MSRRDIYIKNISVPAGWPVLKWRELLNGRVLNHKDHCIQTATKFMLKVFLVTPQLKNFAYFDCPILHIIVYFPSLYLVGGVAV